MTSVTILDSSITGYNKDNTTDYEKIADVAKKSRKLTAQLTQALRGFFDSVLKDQYTASDTRRTIERNRARASMGGYRI